MPDHPYLSLPDYAFWRRSIAARPVADVDPVVRGAFRISRTDRIATAGSCFAQHIARHLAENGFNYLITERVHPAFAGYAHSFNYGVFTARYGNIYTARQFLQTVQRAYGLFTPQDEAWLADGGRVIDPYRPTIQPEHFACLEELRSDRRQHFAAIRRMVEELDVLIFTLGLTEAWHAKIDGAVYPICPGVSGGTFDPERYGFMNQRVGEVVSDLTEAIALVRTKNTKARFVLTVSPVPLIATMEDRSVLVSTTYSKSVLRVAAEEVAAAHDGVCYFPSYEIITGNFTRGGYFSDGLRDVTEAGVQHVMRLFLKHYTDFAVEAGSADKPTDPTKAPDSVRGSQALEEVVAALCDELLLDAPDVSPARPAAVQAPDPDSVEQASVQSSQAVPATLPPSTPTVAPDPGWDILKPPLPFSVPSPEEPAVKPRRSYFLSWLRKAK
ncbi:MAG: GSCFA domain-containing protein [Proteobacteria bacterium]|nr:GSCFA domain-containing protein [Pseudomonadota bacterium]